MQNICKKILYNSKSRCIFAISKSNKQTHKTMKKMPQDFDQLLKLDDLKKGTIFYELASRIINVRGWYSCTYDNKKTIVIK